MFPEDDPNLARELTELARLLPAGRRILVGGRAARAYHRTLVQIGAIQTESLEDLSTRLDALRRGD